jgi:hypothetical protein
VAGWARQGIESFVAAQRILLDLAAQENALLIGMLRERLHKPAFRPVVSIAGIADKGFENFTAAGKVLLDLAAGETALAVDGVKEGLRLPVAACALADLVRHRVDAFIGMQKHLLNAATEQTHAVAESYREGKGLMAGERMAELVRQGIMGFVETEKKFLDFVAQEVTTVTKGGKKDGKPARDRFKLFTELAREGVEKYIDAQKKLLDLTIDQFEAVGEAASPRKEVAHKEPRTSWAELTEKSVRNLVTAQKSLMDLAIKPIKEPTTDEIRKASRARPRGKKQRFEEGKAAGSHAAAA